jgi:hypothetical protein
MDTHFKAVRDEQALEVDAVDVVQDAVRDVERVDQAEDDVDHCEPKGHQSPASIGLNGRLTGGDVAVASHLEHVAQHDHHVRHETHQGRHVREHLADQERVQLCK